MPLAVRMSATTAMVVAAALLVVAGLTVQIARHHLSAELDHRLQANADSFRNGPARRVTAPGQLAGEAATWLASQALDSDEVVAVRTADGAVLTRTGGLELRSLPGWPSCSRPTGPAGGTWAPAPARYGCSPCR
jgi:hypothetical protein